MCFARRPSAPTPVRQHPPPREPHERQVHVLAPRRPPQGRSPARPPNLGENDSRPSQNPCAPGEGPTVSEDYKKKIGGLRPAKESWPGWRPVRRPLSRTSPSVRSSRHRTTHAPTATTANRSAASFAFLKGLHEALVLGIATTAHRSDGTMFGQSSRFQPVAQLDHRRRIPLAAGRARYLASV
jgi:hypothetical protein